jgi:hypothetical protein
MDVRLFLCCAGGDVRAADGGDGDRTAEHGKGEHRSKSEPFHRNFQFRRED